LTNAGMGRNIVVSKPSYYEPYSPNSYSICL